MRLKSATVVAIVLATFAICAKGEPACTNVLKPFSSCGGLGSGCRGSQCRDGPWADVCCPSGQQCNRKTQWHFKCEDAPLDCPAYTGTPCAKLVPTYGTCGGLASGCQGCQCKDGLWDGYCCAPGAVCNRKTPFYHKCEPGANTPVGSAPASLDPINLDLITSHIKPPGTVPKPEPAAKDPVEPATNTLPAKPAPQKPEKPAALPDAAAGACVGAPVPLYATCGGKGSGCEGAECRDGPWPGKCCVGVCVRKTPWYWKCEEAPKAPCAPYSGPACGIQVLDEWAPCGGKGSGCEGCTCQDAPWAGICCPKGQKCMRKTEWHWKCEAAK